jgi:hypothetical protein
VKAGFGDARDAWVSRDASQPVGRAAGGGRGVAFADARDSPDSKDADECPLIELGF